MRPFGIRPGLRVSKYALASTPSESMAAEYYNSKNRKSAPRVARSASDTVRTPWQGPVGMILFGPCESFGRVEVKESLPVKC